MKPERKAPANKTITCFLPVGRAPAVLERLRVEKGIHSAFAHHARGAGLANRYGKNQPLFLERDIITILVAAEQADEIFEFVYFAAGIDKPHAGMVLMGAAASGAFYILPELPEEQPAEKG